MVVENKKVVTEAPKAKVNTEVKISEPKVTDVVDSKIKDSKELTGQKWKEVKEVKVVEPKVV